MIGFLNKMRIFHSFIFKKLQLYVVDRDATVGSPKYTEKCRAVEGSRKIIILLSNSYLANPSCLAEADLVAGKMYKLVNNVV